MTIFNSETQISISYRLLELILINKEPSPK